MNPPLLSEAEAEQNAVSLITAALDHNIRGDGDALTLQELLAVLGDRPLVQMPQQLGVVVSITAYILRNAAKDDDSARDWWARIARHLLSEDLRVRDFPASAGDSGSPRGHPQPRRTKLMALPVLSAEDRARALESARIARKTRSEALAELTSGKLPVATVLAGREPRLARAFVRQVIEAVPGIGKVTREKLMADAGIADNRRVQGLGANQRTALTAALAA